LATKPQLLSELWHQRLGHPGLTQLGALAKHSTGLPSLLTMHPMHSCQACNDETIQRADKGPISDTALLLPGTRFHLDFGFIRASSADFGITMGNCMVTSYNGNNSYLIIFCAKICQTWVFFQASKSPMIFIIERFLALNGLKSGPRYLHMDQGGELWRSNELRTLLLPHDMTLNQLVPMMHPIMAKLNGPMTPSVLWYAVFSTVLAYIHVFVCCIGTHCLSEEPPLSQALVYDAP
jgi:hypothetical protein